MTNYRFLLATLGLAAGLAHCPTARADLIADGSFETPTVPAGSFTDYVAGTTIPSTTWSVVGAAGNVAIVDGAYTSAGITFPAQSGNQWLDLTGGGSNTATGVQQTVATTAGTYYTLSFYIGNVNNPGGPYGTDSTVDLSIGGAPMQTFTNGVSASTSTLQWEQFSTTFQATGSSTTIEFLNGDPGTDNSNGLDNVSLVPTTVPLPAAFWLLASGLAGICALRRRTADAA